MAKKDILLKTYGYFYNYLLYSSMLALIKRCLFKSFSKRDIRTATVLAILAL